MSPASVNQQSAYGKSKAQIICAVAAQMISPFVFATQIVHFLFYLNRKFQAPQCFLRLYRLVCVGPGQKLKLLFFSCEGPNICSTDAFSTDEEPKITEASEQPDLDPALVLRKAAQTECDSESVTVAISKNVLQVSCTASSEKDLCQSVYSHKH